MRNRKLSLALLGLLILISTAFPTNTFANTDSSDSGFSLGEFACGEPVISDEVDKAIDDYKENDANMAEKFVTGQVQNFLHIGDINGLSTLIFGNPYCIWGDGKDQKMSADGVFTVNERESIINPLLKLFGSVCTLLLALSMLITGLKTMTNSIRGQAMDEFWTDAKMWVWAMFLFYFYEEWVNILFQLNAAVVLSIKELADSDSNIHLDSFSTMSSFEDFSLFMGSYVIVILGEWILSGILNVVYIARKVIILLLLVMGFIAIYSLLFSKTRAFFGTWLRELCGNIFLQSIHSIIFFTMLKFTALGSGVFFKLALMMMFIPVAGMISKWLNIGDSSSKLGSSLTMVGLGGISSTMMLASQAGNIMRGGSLINNGGAFNSSSTNSSNGGSLTDIANSVANDALTTSIASSATGTNSSVFNAAKAIASSMGGTVGGISGAVAGPAGVVIGTNLGSKIAEGTIQVGRNAYTGISRGISTVSEATRFKDENGTGLRTLFNKDAGFNTLNARRQMMGNVGESLGVMLGGQYGASVGRKVGFALSGVSRERLSENMANGFGVPSVSGNYQPLTFDYLAQKFPDAEAKWVQTNQGSAFFVNSDNGWQQVGLTGAADSSLSMGEARVMDYKLSNPSLQYEYQPNGTYKAPTTYSEADVGGNSYLNSTPSTPGNLETLGLHGASSTIGQPDMSGVNSYVNSTPGSLETIGLQETASSVVRTSDTYGESANVNSTPGSIETIGLQETASSVVRTSDTYGESSNVNSTPGSIATIGLHETTSSNTSQSESYGANAYVNSTPGKMETTGLQGSTPSVMRQSDAYIVNTGDTSKMAMSPQVINAISSSKSIKYQDKGFDSKSVNPDAYVYNKVPGISNQTTTDRTADKVSSLGQIGKWKSKAVQQTANKRSKKIV